MRTKIWSGIGLLLVSIFLDSSPALAAQDDDYNFSWLDPEKKIYVLQNRRYRKAGTPQFYAMGGFSLGDTYRSVIQAQPRLAWWMNEDMGFEVFYSYRSHSPNNVYEALDKATNGGAQSPYIREVRSQFGVLYNWAPWYAKINVFNSVLYFDWYFSIGGGMIGTMIGQRTEATDATKGWRTQNLFAAYLGTGHLFHLSEHWKIRLDVLGHFYLANVFEGLTGVAPKQAVFSNFTSQVGIGYQL
jgi:outer membrane beta-barrel protein